MFVLKILIATHGYGNEWEEIAEGPREDIEKAAAALEAVGCDVSVEEVAK